MENVCIYKEKINDKPYDLMICKYICMCSNTAKTLTTNSLFNINL